jgi:tRNA(His) guanylyltransferase
MAKSRWDYVKKFELLDALLPETWIVARIDGRGKLASWDFCCQFMPNWNYLVQVLNTSNSSVIHVGFHKLAKTHGWGRPNDIRGIGLMNRAAKAVMEDFNDIVLSYGQSDEYSFVFRKEAEVMCYVLEV